MAANGGVPAEFYAQQAEKLLDSTANEVLSTEGRQLSGPVPVAAPVGADRVLALWARRGSRSYRLLLNGTAMACRKGPADENSSFDANGGGCVNNWPNSVPNAAASRDWR